MTVQKQPFMLADNLVVVATQLRIKTTDPYRGRINPSLFIMFGGTETDDGATALTPCSIHVYGEEAIRELQAACAFALLPQTIQKLEGNA